MLPTLALHAKSEDEQNGTNDTKKDRCSSWWNEKVQRCRPHSWTCMQRAFFSGHFLENWILVISAANMQRSAVTCFLLQDEVKGEGLPLRLSIICRKRGLDNAFMERLSRPEVLHNESTEVIVEGRVGVCSVRVTLPQCLQLHVKEKHSVLHKLQHFVTWKIALEKIFGKRLLFWQRFCARHKNPSSSQLNPVFMKSKTYVERAKELQKPLLSRLHLSGAFHPEADPYLILRQRDRILEHNPGYGFKTRGRSQRSRVRPKLGEVVWNKESANLQFPDNLGANKGWENFVALISAFEYVNVMQILIFIYVSHYLAADSWDQTQERSFRLRSTAHPWSNPPSFEKQHFLLQPSKRKFPCDLFDHKGKSCHAKWFTERNNAHSLRFPNWVTTSMNAAKTTSPSLADAASEKERYLSLL